MANKALLIGSETGDLRGVAHDVGAMAEALGRWGFGMTRCERENASRAGILDAYERLISEARSDDAVVVYYSGHGAYAAHSGQGLGTPGHRSLQLIVPTDFAASTEDDFRGITSPELSVLLARLTERTHNVTVVLDCCHSGHMSRDDDRVVKGHARPVSWQMARAHLDALGRTGLGLDRWNPLGNPHAVRIVACSPEQQAYEAPNADGVSMGYLTDALTRALTEARESGLTVSWATVVDRVRQRVLRRWAGQRPEAEGPARRVLFGTEEADPVATLPVTLVGDRLRIAGAALLGVRPGDELAVMPDDSPEPDDSRKLGDVRVDAVDARAAHGPFAPVAPGTHVPLGARAHLVRTVQPALPVSLDGTRLPALARAVELDPLLRLSEPGEDAPVRVEISGAGLSVCDIFGAVHAPWALDSSGFDQVLSALKRWARGQALRCLTPEPALELPTPVSVQFARVSGDETVQLAGFDSCVYSGQSVCVTVRNDGYETVYVSLLDVGVSAQVALLNPSAPSGIRLDPGKEYVFGGNDLTGELPGMAVSWPASVPGGQARPETMVVLVTAEPTDTRVLQQDGIRGTLSTVEQRLWAMRTGGSREVAPDAGRPVRFAVRTIEFDLMPNPAPVFETAVFQVDDRPAQAALLRHPPADAGVILDVALSDVVVHHNRAFRHPDVRLDTLVVTSVGDVPESYVHTERFTGIHDGAQLAPSGVPIFQGAARDRVDIAVWVSPLGREPVPDLAAHLRETGMPDRNGSAAALIESACRFLQETTGETVGLFRTTLLVSKKCGLADSVPVRAGDFSFRCVFGAHEPKLVSGPSE